MSESVSREPTHNQHPLNECIWLIWGYTITIAILSGFVVSRRAYTNHTCTQLVSLMPEGLHYHSTWMSWNDSLRPTISPPLSIVVFPDISTVLYPSTQSVSREPTGWPPLCVNIGLRTFSTTWRLEVEDWSHQNWKFRSEILKMSQ